MEEFQNKKDLYFKRVYDNIKSVGYHTTAVLEEQNSTPFAYSTGVFENFKIPELFISGLGPNLSGLIIEKYVEEYKFSSIPLNERLNNFIENFPVVFINVNKEDLNEYVLTSIKFYEDNVYEYLQLIFPDLDGKFPNEADYNYDQKIIGRFEMQ